MRVTNSMMLSTLMIGMANASERLINTHQMLASGKRIQRPSDDPVAMNTIIGYKQILNGLQQYTRNIGFADDYLINAETALSDINDSLGRLKELAVTTATETSGAQARQSTSYEVDQIFSSLISSGNTQVGEAHLFAGFKTDSDAFDAAGNYLGDANKSAVFIGKGESFTYGFTGDRIFKGVGVTGGVDIFKMVDDLRTGLQTNDTALITGTIDQFDKAMDQVSDATADIGGRMNRLRVHKEHTDGFINQTRILLSDMEDADIAEISTSLVLEQSNLEALQLSTAKFTALTIFNFIR